MTHSTHFIYGYMASFTNRPPHEIPGVSSERSAHRGQRLSSRTPPGTRPPRTAPAGRRNTGTPAPASPRTCAGCSATPSLLERHWPVPRGHSSSHAALDWTKRACLATRSRLGQSQRFAGSSECLELVCSTGEKRKEGKKEMFLFNDVLNTFVFMVM